MARARFRARRARRGGRASDHRRHTAIREAGRTPRIEPRAVFGSVFQSGRAQPVKGSTIRRRRRRRPRYRTVSSRCRSSADAKSGVICVTVGTTTSRSPRRMSNPAGDGRPCCARLGREHALVQPKVTRHCGHRSERIQSPSPTCASRRNCSGRAVTRLARVLMIDIDDFKSVNDRMVISPEMRSSGTSPRF